MARCTVLTVLSLPLEKISYAEQKYICPMRLCQKLGWLRASDPPSSFVSLNSFNVCIDDAKRLCFTPKTGLDFTQPKCLTD